MNLSELDLSEPGGEWNTSPHALFEKVKRFNLFCNPDRKGSSPLRWFAFRTVLFAVTKLWRMFQLVLKKIRL